MNRVRAFALSAAAVALAACSGCASGGALRELPSAGTSAGSPAVPHRAKDVAAVVRFVIPPRVLTLRRPHFVSGATMGVEIASKNLASGATIVTVASVAPTSSNCAADGSARKCAVATLLPVGKVQISVTTYDQAPAGGKFPSGSHVLGIGAVRLEVVAGKTPQIVIYLGGAIASLAAAPAFASLPADGRQHEAGFVITPQDFGNQPIHAGKNDPYHNPIAVALTESGGSGHAVLVFDGTAGGTSATMRYSTDTIAVQYDGGGSPGYLIGVEFSASGVPAQHVQVAPMYLASSSSMYAGGRLVLQGRSKSAAVVLSEAGTPPATQRYDAIPAGCSDIASVSTTTNAAAGAAFAVTGGATASASGCSIAFGDGTSSLTIDASNTPSSGGVTLPGTVLNTFGVPDPIVSMPPLPSLMALGPDQQLWFVDAAHAVQSASTSGTFASFPIAPALPVNLTAGPDGAMWITDSAGPSVVRLFMGTPISYPVPVSAAPTGITTGPDGYLWFADTGNNQIDQMSVTGTIVNTFAIPTSGASPQNIADGPDNALWITEQGTSKILRVPTSGYPITEQAVSAKPLSIALGPDNRMWFTEPLAGAVGSISTDGAMTVNVYSTGAGSDPTIIARGPDNAMYFVESGSAVIGRIDVTSHAITTFALPGGGSGPAGIVTGPDNNVWYTLQTSNQLVQMNP